MQPVSEIEARRVKLQALRDRGVDPYPNDFRVSHTVRDIQRIVEQSPEAVTENEPVFVTGGRLVAVNRFGKTAFVRFRDRTGQLQAYVRRDLLGDHAFALFKEMDVGDFVGLRGGVFRTRTGEWTLLVKELRLLCKALRPLPEKFHGIKDPEKRYRQRYLDLTMNAEVREIFLKRNRVVRAVRSFLEQRDFLEVETPMMQPIPGGAEAAPFKTHHNALSMDLFLRIAPELYLKRLVVGGLERVFEINRNFRNEGVSTQHNPEFTMLEFYQAYATYEDLMHLTEAMLRHVAEQVNGSTTITYQGRTIDLSAPWRRMTLEQALHELGGVPLQALGDRQCLLGVAEERGIQIQKAGQTGKILTKLFDVLVEPLLVEPTFITQYPVEVSPLSRRCRTDPDVTERFELFIGGFEIANGFSELNDPQDQRQRFLDQAARRGEGDEEAHLMDEDYVEALEYGMPPTAGEGMGIDRLTMLLTDAASIREVILFPHMRQSTPGRQEG